MACEIGRSAEQARDPAEEVGGESGARRADSLIRGAVLAMGVGAGLAQSG